MIELTVTVFPDAEEKVAVNVPLPPSTFVVTALIEIDGAKSVKVKYLLVLAYLNLENNTTACIYIDEIKDEPLVKNLELGRFCN